MCVLQLNGWGGDQGGLMSAYEDAFLVGAAINRNQVAGGEPKALNLAREHFNSVTPENDLKWEKVHPEPGQFNFGPGDRLVALAEANDWALIGHTLVWHQQTPDWVFQDEDGNLASAELLRERLKDHILTVAGRYRGKIHGWDVANEIFNDDGSWRESLWYTILGEEYLYLAFEYAQKADPSAELYYNDYNLWKASKREAVINLVQALRKRGLRIDAVGFQGHYGLDYPDLKDLEGSLKAMKMAKIPTMVTELDISLLPFPNADQRGADISLNFELQAHLNPYPDGLPPEMEKQLTKRYVSLFKLFNKYQDNMTRVTFWGITDNTTWRNNWPVHGRTDYPLLFDRNYQAKPAVEEVLKLSRN